MKMILNVILFSIFAGCGSNEEKPNPLEKADVDLPVLEMPLGHFPSKEQGKYRPKLKKTVAPKEEFALEGLIEVADPDSFKPQKLFVKFILERGDRRITAGTNFGGTPIPAGGKLFRYRCAMDAPKRARTYVLEVYDREDNLFASADIIVKEPEK